jgi:hypothetical protein
MAIIAIAQRKLFTLETSQLSQRMVPMELYGVSHADVQTLADMPHHFLCSISLLPMTGPVYLLDGSGPATASDTTPIYDYESIDDWIRRGGNTDPMTGVKLVNPVILRPNLPLQREIAEWCRQHDVPYKPRQWSKDTEVPVAPRMSCARQLLKASKAVGRFLTSTFPHHPFQTYQYATK